MKKYSYQELAQMEQDISNFIVKEEKLDSPLIFKLRQNLRKIKEAKEIIEEDFEVADEDQKKELSKFQDERIKLVKKYDGDLKFHDNGTIEVLNANELNNNTEFIEELEELQEKYEDTIQEVEEYDKRNLDKSQEDQAEIQLVEIPLDLFPKELSDSFKESFLDFVKD